MNPVLGISRIIYVLHILGIIWIAGCSILTFKELGMMIYGGLLYRQISIEVIVLMADAMKWIGLGVLGILISEVFIWILKGFINE